MKRRAFIAAASGQPTEPTGSLPVGERVLILDESEAMRPLRGAVAVVDGSDEVVGPVHEALHRALGSDAPWQIVAGREMAGVRGILEQVAQMATKPPAVTLAVWDEGGAVLGRLGCGSAYAYRWENGVLRESTPDWRANEGKAEVAQVPIDSGDCLVLLGEAATACLRREEVLQTAGGSISGEMATAWLVNLASARGCGHPAVAVVQFERSGRSIALPAVASALPSWFRQGTASGALPTSAPQVEADQLTTPRGRMAEQPRTATSAALARYQLWVETEGEGIKAGRLAWLIPIVLLAAAGFWIATSLGGSSHHAGQVAQRSHQLAATPKPTIAPTTVHRARKGAHHGPVGAQHHGSHHQPRQMPTKAPTRTHKARATANRANSTLQHPTPPATVPPSPTPVPPTAVPPPTAAAAPPAVASRPASFGDPASAVVQFYQLVAQHHFGSAALLWTPQMRAAYPPPVYIDDRFAGTERITVEDSRVVALDPAAGRATVAVDVVEVDANPPATHRFVGSWQLVRAPTGWLLARPDLVSD